VEVGSVPIAGGLTPKPDKQLDNIGRVVDFSVIKELGIWLEEYWDHKFLMWTQDPFLAIMDDQVQPLTGPIGIVEVPFNPTAENIARYLVEVVGPRVLPKGIRLVKVVIDETRKCSASYEVFR
jgi:6-pyruvoyltetrahydropterin/6-carboxytetrahydropterin synthase